MSGVSHLGHYQLQFRTIPSGQTTIRITDATGRLVLQQHLTNSTTIVSLPNAAAGLYFVTIWDEAGLRWRGRTVVR